MYDYIMHLAESHVVGFCCTRINSVHSHVSFRKLLNGLWWNSVFIATLKLLKYFIYDPYELTGPYDDKFKKKKNLYIFIFPLITYCNYHNMRKLQVSIILYSYLPLKHNTNLLSFDVISIKVTPFYKPTSCHSNSFYSILVRANICFKQSMLLLKILHTS